MFYLSETFNFCRKYLLRVLSLSALSISILVLFCNFEYFQKEVSKYLPSIENEHYFNLLIEDKVNALSIQRKILGLPGVINFEQIGENSTKESILTLNQELGLTKEEKAELTKMVSYKISMKPELNQSSIDLIREYIGRLAGQDNIMLGSVKKKLNNEAAFQNLLLVLKKWPLHIILSVLGSFWIVSFLSIKTEINRIAFIIENFQRKKNVAMKMLYTLLIANVAVSLLVSYFILQPNFYSVLLSISLVFLVPFSVFGKRRWVRA